MSTKSKLMLTRKQLADFLSDPDAIKAFERVFNICDTAEDALAIPTPPLNEVPFQPLVTAPTTDSTYTLPNVVGVHRVYFPKAYMVAASGGPWTVTITTGSGDVVKVPICKAGDTLDSGNLLFNVYIDSSGNTTSDAWQVSAHNSNGSWIKFADGTMECLAGYVALSVIQTTFTFPATFIATPVVHPTLDSFQPEVSPIGTLNRSTTGFIFNIATAGGSRTGCWRAIGRWK